MGLKLYRDSATGAEFYVMEPEPFDLDYDGRPKTQQAGQPQQGQGGQQQGGMDPQQMYNMYQKFSGGGAGATTNPGASSPYASNAGMYGPSGTYGAGGPTYGYTAPTTMIESGALSAGGEAGGAAGGSSSSGYSAAMSGPWAYVAAAIAAQALATSHTDRRAGDDYGDNVSRTEGHRTGNVFSGDFFTEPWQPYLYQAVGNDRLTPGEKTDAAIDRFREGKGGFGDVARSAPATGAQWFDPAGSVGYDMLEDKGGKAGSIIGKAVFPLQWIARLFG